MSKSPVEYLRHILDELDYLAETSAGLGEPDFAKNLTLQKAFVRSLEIVGEAVKNLPEDFKAKYLEVSWKSYAGLRDRLIHHYFGVDYGIVWDVVSKEAPELKGKIETILKKLQSQK